jgi:hypothetical protein
MRELPVIACVRHILRSTYAFRRQAVRIALPWTAAFTALNAAKLLTDPAIGTAAGRGSANMQVTALEFLVAILAVFATSAIAVNWHRYILRDEEPAASNLLRLDGLTLRYFGTLLLILLAALVVAVMISLPFTLLAPRAFPVPLLAVFIVTLAYGRFGLALPATALGRNDFGLRAAVKATEGNTWRILGVLAICFAMILGVFVALLIALGVALALGKMIFLTVFVLATIPANIFISILTTSQLNSLYGFFVEGRNF